MRTGATISAAIAVGLVLAGCASDRGPSMAALDQFIDQQTAFTVDNYNYAGRSGVLASDNRNAVIITPHKVGREWSIIVDGKFNGTVEGLTKKVASLLDYRTAAEGEKPPSPIQIIIQKPNLTALGLVREGFAQARTRATLRIDQNARVLTVIYKRPESTPLPHQDDVIL